MLLLQARIRHCDGESRRSALRHTARVCVRASHLRVPILLHVCTLSRRTVMNMRASGSMRSWVPASPLHRSISGGWPHCSVHYRADVLVVFSVCNCSATAGLKNQERKRWGHCLTVHRIIIASWCTGGRRVRTDALQDAQKVRSARPQRVKTGSVPSGAHGATNKEHQVCARRRVSEAAGSQLRI